MDTDEPFTPDMPSRRPHKHWCKVCNKKFLSGKALGGHMSRHRQAGKQPKSTASPPAIVIDLPVLGPSDDKPSPSSLESQGLHCSKVFSSIQSPRGNMGMHSEKKVMGKPDEEPEPAGLMEAWANANGDHGHNAMLFSPVKRKRSKRGMTVLNSEMNAAVALLMLAEHSDKNPAYEDFCGEDKDDNISTPMVLKGVNLNAFEQLVEPDEFRDSARLKSDKNPAYEDFCGGDKDDSISTPMVLQEVNLNAFEQLVQPDEFTNSARLNSDKNPAYEGFYEHCTKENSLNLVVDAPKKEVLLNVFDYEMDVGAELVKPWADISVEELKSNLNLVADAPKKDVLLNVFDHGMGVDPEFLKPRADISVELLKSSLNLVADAPKKEVLLNVFDHRMGVDSECMKPGVDISVGELKSSDLSAATKSKSHQCKVCGKLMRSGQALGGHMTLHLHFEKKSKLSLVADLRKEVLLNAFDNEVNADVEFMTPGAAFPVELESSDKNPAYEDFCGGDKDDNISTPMVLKDVNLNTSEQLVQPDEFTNSARLKSDKNPAYEGFYEHCEKENRLNLAADAPKKEVLVNVFGYEMDVDAEFMKAGPDISVEELKSSLNLGTDAPKKKVLLNVFDHGMGVDAEFMKQGADISVEVLKSTLNLVADAPKKEVLPNVFDQGMGVDAEFTKPGVGISVEELKSSDLSAATKNKRHQCKVCGKIMRSGQALGGHMTLHIHFEKKSKLSLTADLRKEVLLNAFDNEVNADVEFMTPGAAFSVELESSDISAAVNVKKHQCKVCGKSLGSGHALGGHMRSHYVRKCNLHQDVADCPDSVMMEEQMQKLELDSPIFYRRRPHSHGRQSDSEP